MIDYKKCNGRVTIFLGIRGRPSDPDACLRVFDGLYSADILHHNHGTGLGLAVAKVIIEEHGGAITYKSQKETVTEIEIIFSDTVARIDLL